MVLRDWFEGDAFDAAIAFCFCSAGSRSGANGTIPIARLAVGRCAGERDSEAKQAGVNRSLGYCAPQTSPTQNPWQP